MKNDRTHKLIKNIGNAIKEALETYSLDSDAQNNDPLASIQQPKTKSAIRSKIYSIINKSGLTSKVYRDENWQGPRDVQTLLNRIGFIEEVYYYPVDGGYRKNAANDAVWKEYELEITVGKYSPIIIKGKITCSPCGSMDDIWNRYDITVSLY